MPRVSDAGTIDTLASYAPPTSERGQGGAFAGADNDANIETLDEKSDASHFNSYHQTPTSGQRGGAD